MSRKQILLLAGAGSLCLIGLAGYIVAAGDLVATILFAYLLAALGFVALMIYRTWHRDVMSLDNIQGAQMASQGFVSRASSLAGSMLETLQFALSWPATLYLLIRTILPIAKNLANRKLLLREHLSATTELSEGVQFYGSVCMACLTVIWFLIVNTGSVHSIYAIGLLYLVVASVMVRHLASFWNPDGVVAGFKQTEGSPIVKFAIVLVCDVTTLVLAFGWIRASRTGTLVGLGDLVRTAKGLVSLGDTLPQMIQGGPAAVVHQVTILPRTERLVLAAGLLLYVVLIKTAKDGYKQFAREDGDYLAMARASIAKGKYEKALEQIGKVKHFSTESEEQRLVPLLARGNVEKAKQCARRMLEMNPSFSDEVTADDIYWELLTRATILPPDFRLKLWQAALVDGVSGSVLLLVVNSWMDEPELLDTIFSAPAHPSQAIPFAHFLLGIAKPEEAIQCLGDTMPAGLEDRVSFRSLFLIAVIKLQERVDAKRLVATQWAGTEREAYERECQSLFDGTYWRQFLVFLMVSFVFCELVQFASPESAWFKGLREKARDRLKSTEQGRTAWRLYCASGGEQARFDDPVAVANKTLEAAEPEAAAS